MHIWSKLSPFFEEEDFDRIFREIVAKPIFIVNNTDFVVFIKFLQAKFVKKYLSYAKITIFHTLY